MPNYRDTDTNANVEQVVSDESMGAKQALPFDSPVCIHIHSIRSRLVDSDGVSAKAAIDGIVKAGVLQDDSAKYVKEVSYSQEKGFPEKTVIKITRELTNEKAAI